MSDSQPDASPRVTWEEVHEQTVAYVSETTQQLQEFCDDEGRDRSTRMLALLVLRGFSCLEMALLHSGALERRHLETKVLLRDFMKASLKLAGVEEEIRQDLEQRVEQVEYAAVAEGQQERLVEQLAGDVLDVIGDMLKGKDDSEDADEDDSEDDS